VRNPSAYLTVPSMLSWLLSLADHDVNVANNTFNWQLQEYGTAVARLDRYVLADGRPEVWEDQPTGEYDDMGNEIMPCCDSADCR
jgi:hypothetical protein